MDRGKLFSDVNKYMAEIFGNKLKKIFLYGSYAKNKQTKESDIDFFVLVDETEEDLKKVRYRIADVMAELSLNHDVLVSITEETLNRFMEYSEILPFYQIIKKEGVVIYGK
ncbi:MAG: nucleotidyltransferase domain-containing protein [candidate division KSB1 bacterium]|nr:nucleotidyltransferase domain-containing protein [candidate division KSB1 bacterium]